MAHLHRWALACLGVWVGWLLQAARRGIGTASTCEAGRPDSRRSKGQVNHVPGDRSAASYRGAPRTAGMFDAIVFPAGCTGKQDSDGHGTALCGPSAVASWADGGPGPKETSDENGSLLACCSIPRRVPLHPVRRLACLADGHGRSPGSAALVVRRVRRLTPCFESRRGLGTRCRRWTRMLGSGPVSA